MKRKKPTLILKVRRYQDAIPKVGAYLILRDGPCDSCLMYGEISPDSLETLRNLLAIEVEEEVSPLSRSPHVSADTARKKAKKVKGIFD